MGISKIFDLDCTRLGYAWFLIGVCLLYPCIVKRHSLANFSKKVCTLIEHVMEFTFNLLNATDNDGSLPGQQIWYAILFQESEPSSGDWKPLPLKNSTTFPSKVSPFYLWLSTNNPPTAPQSNTIKYCPYDPYEKFMILCEAILGRAQTAFSAGMSMGHIVTLKVKTIPEDGGIIVGVIDIDP